MPVQALICAAIILAQPAGPATPPAPARPAAPAQPPAPAQPAAPAAPPQGLLGLRVDRTRLDAAVIPEVLIVHDASSYLNAIANWNPQRRFPVLIDDGTDLAREDIARFIRAFEPNGVLDLPAAADAPAWTAVNAEAVTAAAASAWQSDKAAPVGAIAANFKAAKHRPPGVVCWSPKDPAWPGAVALAAGRGQLLVEVSPGAGVDAVIQSDQADTLCRQIEAACEATGLTWKGLGDDLDAVTLALHTPNRIASGTEFLALTDRVGRLGDGAAASTRWAWCGELFGTPAQSSYRAMCSLFLQPRTAWLFDGYEAGQPWNRYDAGDAAKTFKDFHFTSEVLDTPRQSIRDWRARAARPVAAGLIFVNSKGNDDFFDLQPGRGKPGDLPVLSLPAAAHMVHSWSATNIGRRSGVGGRWLERGVFCYAGSVHEPFLQAFVPTPALAGRLVSRAPWGVAARVDGGQQWKIGIYGDPLFTLGDPALRVAQRLSIPGATRVGDNLRALLDGEQFVPAIDALIMLRREEDAARLGEALLANAPDKLTPPVAARLVPPCFQTGRNELLWRLYAKQDDLTQKEPWRRDLLWLASWPLLEGKAPEDLLRLLKAHVRPDQPVEDAMRLAGSWRKTFDDASAAALLVELRNAVAEGPIRDHLSRAMKDSPDNWGR